MKAATVAAAGVVLVLAASVLAVDRSANPGNFSSQISAALPGDRVILAPGTYGSKWLANKNGTSGQLIQVVAQDPTNRPVFQTSNLECLQLASCSYMLWDGIVVQGATEEGIHLQQSGSNPFSNHIIFRNCSVTMAPGGGNTDNWKSDYSTDTLFYNCNAAAAEDCNFDFMGCHDSLVMRSTMTNNGNSGVHAKSSSYNVGFYKNVFTNAGERNLQFGGNSTYSRDEVAMGNILIGSPYAAVYTTVRYCDFKYNTIVNPTSAVIRMLNENPSGGVTTAYNTFARNLVQAGCSTLAYGSNTEPATFTYADDFWSQAPSWPAGCSETGTVVGDPQLDGSYRPLNSAAKDYGAHAPGMEAAWSAYTSRFAWAWGYAANYDPNAEAGGVYKVYKHGSLGGSATLNGAGSYAGNNPNAGMNASYHQNVISDYTWDMNGNNVFGDAGGAAPSVTYAQLAGWGRGASGTYQIELAITVDTDYGQIKDWDVAGLVVADACTGDLDFDGDVDFADYQVLESNFGTTGRNWTHGDFSGDGDVDFGDYQLLESNFGTVLPEPATLSALALGGLAAIRRGRR